MANYVLFSNEWNNCACRMNRSHVFILCSIFLSVFPCKARCYLVCRIRSRKRLNPDTQTAVERCRFDALKLLSNFHFYISCSNAIKNAFERRRIKLIEKNTKIHFKMPILNSVEIVLIKRDFDWRDAFISFGFISFYVMNWVERV